MPGLSITIPPWGITIRSPAGRRMLSLADMLADRARRLDRRTVKAIEQGGLAGP